MQKELIRTKKKGSFYSFVYYNSTDQKRIRLSREYIRSRFGKDIIDPDEADQIMAILSKELNTLSEQKKERSGLSKEDYNYKGLMEMYLVDRKKLAPNSYKNNIHYMKYYVLHFFLKIQGCKNLEEWYIYYEDFKEWLEDKATLITKPDTPLAYASKNHAIRALNTFMRLMYRKRYVLSLHLCQQFPEHLLKEKSINDVVSKEHMEKIYQGFIHKNQKEIGVFYRLIYETGMRYNEARGVSLDSLHVGAIPYKSMHTKLKMHDIEYYGYIVLKSQPKRNKSYIRDQDGHVPRKPLKTRKKMDNKSGRVIPIKDKILWNDLAEIFNKRAKEHKKRIYGVDLNDYLLFDKINSGTLTRLRRLCARLGIPYKSWHNLRHTRATELIGDTSDNLLAQMWLGHRKQEVLDKYVHVYEAIVSAASKVKDGEVEPITTSSCDPSTL